MLNTVQKTEPSPIVTAREVLRGDLPPEHSSLLLDDFMECQEREPLFFEPEKVTNPPTNLPQAIAECLQALSAEARRPYPNRRLSARICQAIRTELTSLVAEWEAVNAGK